MAWTCDLTEDRLLEAMEGTLESAEQAELQRHIAGCPQCAQLEQSVRQTVGQLHQLEAVEPSPWLVPKIIAQTTGARRPRRRWGWFDAIAQPRFALGVVTVLVTFTVLFQTVSGGGPPTLADMNPVNVYRQIDRRAHLVYARSVKFLSDLRVVYEIQSRFQPESQTNPGATPEKKTTDELQRLFYGRLESCDRPAAIVIQGDPHELRHPS
jgi:anti-sigma factor RsiW